MFGGLTSQQKTELGKKLYDHGHKCARIVTASDAFIVTCFYDDDVVKAISTLVRNVLKDISYEVISPHPSHTRTPVVIRRLDPEITANNEQVSHQDTEKCNVWAIVEEH